MAKPVKYFVTCPDCGEINEIVSPAEGYNKRVGPSKRKVVREYPCRGCNVLLVVPWILTRDGGKVNDAT